MYATGKQDMTTAKRAMIKRKRLKAVIVSIFLFIAFFSATLSKEEPPTRGVNCNLVRGGVRRRFNPR
jgi:hypothetical protein